MSNTASIRWKQRLQQFEKASRLLFESARRPVDSLSVLEQAGIVQCFEYTFELSWKTLKDLLYHEGFGDVKTPRETLRQAFEAGYLNAQDTESALDALDKRNLLSHTYEETIAKEALALICERYTPMLSRLLQTLQSKAAASPP